MFVLIEGDGLTGEKFAASPFQRAELGRGRGNNGERGGAGEVDAQGLTHEFRAAAVFTLAGALDLSGDRQRNRDGDECAVAGIDGHRL